MDLNQFKEDVTLAIRQLGKKLIVPIGAIYVIFAILVFGAVFSAFALATGDGTIIFNLENQDKMFEFQAYMRENLGAFFSVMIVFMLIFMLIYAWFLNLFLQISELTIREESGVIGKALSASFSSKVFRIYGFVWATIVLMILMGLIMGIVVSIFRNAMAISVVLAVTGAILMTIVFLRLLAAPGAIVHGNMSLGSAMSFSWGKITMGKAGAMLLVLIGISLVMGLFSAGIDAVVANLSNDPMTMVVLSNVIMLPLNIIVYAYAVAALSTLYYRYAELPDDEEHTDIHLVTE